MKRTALALTLISAMLLSVVAGTFIVDLAQPAYPEVPPIIEIYSPQYKVYYSNEVELNFVAPPSHKLYENISFTSFSYSLDGQMKVAISGNTTVTGLSWGSHKLVVYGIENNGTITSSQTVPFTIFIPSAWIVPTITTVAILAVVGVCLLIALLVYFKKRKR
jgi:hypothetical protein